MNEKTQISIVSTLYNSEIFIEEFVERVLKVIHNLKLSYEIIFVDDGSTDGSVFKVLSLIDTNKNIKLIKFSKNFGHHKAMMAGIINTIGDFVFLIDVDLEEPPELLSSFYHKICETQNDLIYGYQEKRNKDRILGKLFWELLNKITDIKIDNNVCTVRIMSKKFVKKFNYFPQKDFFLGELSSYIGLKQSSLIVNKTFKGKSSYHFFAKYTLLFNMLFTNVNNLWVKLSFFSIILSGITFIFSSFLLLSRILGKVYLSGWLSLMILISFIATINFLFYAVILQMISKVLEENKAKPRFIIDEKINF